jgi:hypothetical protein
MTEQLPISIYVCKDLLKQLININSANVNSIINKLEAQFNFQTMTANWYGDEDNITFIQLLLETPQNFAIKKEKAQTNQMKMFDAYSDDVFSFYDNSESQQLICVIAVTDLEQKILAQKEKLLSGLLQIKCQKVLNIIAKKSSLQPI